MADHGSRDPLVELKKSMDPNRVEALLTDVRSTRAVLSGDVESLQQI